MSDKLFTVATEIVRAGGRGFLTTLQAGLPRTRMVEPLVVEDDGTLWISTSPATRKAAEIRVCPQVTYAAEDRAGDAAVCLYGSAELIDDVTERVARWDEATTRAGSDARARRIFPDGPTGDDYVLIRLRPHTVELIDFGRGIHPEPLGLRCARAEREI